jgi:hypothetical protein
VTSDELVFDAAKRSDKMLQAKSNSLINSAVYHDEMVFVLFIFNKKILEFKNDNKNERRITESVATPFLLFSFML